MQNCHHINLLTYYSTYRLQDVLQTIRLFISDWDGWCDCLQTTAEHDVVWIIWAGDHRKLSCAQCTLERRIAVSCEISRADRCLYGLSSWLSTRSSTAMRWMHGLPLPGCRTIISVLLILFSRRPTFQPLSGNLLSILRASYCFDR